jgi:hypothetical protein
MSVVGQKATSRGDRTTSAYPPVTDIAQGAPQVRFVPTGEIIPLPKTPAHWPGSMSRRIYVSCSIGEPNRRRAGNASVLHGTFQFGAFCEGFRSFDRGKLVSDCNVVRIVGRSVHGLSSDALCLLDGGEIVIGLAKPAQQRVRVDRLGRYEKLAT